MKLYMKLYMKRLRLSATCSIFLSLLLTQSVFAEYRIGAPRHQDSGLEIVVYATKESYGKEDFIVPSGNGYEKFDKSWECALTGGGSIGQDENVMLNAPYQRGESHPGARDGFNREWQVYFSRTGWQPRIRVTCFRWNDDTRMKQTLRSDLIDGS